MGVEILYKDFAVYDKSLLQIKSGVSSTLTEKEKLKADLKNNDKPQLYASFEQRYMDCDVPYEFIDLKKKIGYASNVSLGVNASYLSVGFYFQQMITSRGLTLFFTDDPTEYANKITVVWHNSESNENLLSKTYYPTSNVFECYDYVENYDTLYLTIAGWSKPNRRARLYRVDVGTTIKFTEEDIRRSTVTEVANLVPVEVELNSSEVSILYDDAEYLQEKQKFETYHNGELISEHYVSKITINGKEMTIQGLDLVSILETYDIPTVICTGKTFEECLTNLIFKDFYIDFSVDEDLASIKITSDFPEKIDRRMALTALCLSVGAWVDTTRSGVVHIRSVDKYLSDETVQNVIPETEVLQGDSIEIKEAYGSITGVYGDTEIVLSANNNSEQNLTIEFIVTSEISIASLLKIYAKYYFTPIFYKAKSVVGYEKIGELVDINNRNGLITRRKLILNGNKLFAEGEYKLNG